MWGYTGNMTKMKPMKQTDEWTVLVPKGKYVLGDPCYAVPDDMWMPWLENAKYEDNRLVLVGQTPSGHWVLGLSTQYGDGGYLGSDGFEYGVDAGLIGLVPVEIATNLDRVGNAIDGTIIEFTQDTECSIDTDGFDFRAGRTHKLVFGSVSIETGDGVEDECAFCGEPESWGCDCGDEDDEDDE